jgi:hypothetical protein
MSKDPVMTAARKQSRGRLLATQLELSEVNVTKTSTDGDETPDASARSVAAEGLLLSESSEEDGFFEHHGSTSGSLAPLAGEIELDERERAAPDPSLLSDRRARLRKIVSIVVGGASVLAAFVLVKAMVVRHAQAAPVTASLNSFGPVVASIEMSEKPPAAAGQLDPNNEPSSAEPATEQVEEVRIEVFDDAVEPAPAAAPKVNPSAAPAPSARPATKMDARRLLAAGKLKDAVIAARAALAADPTDAETYLLLGAALQDTGNWQESMIMFASCEQNAKRGPIGDCRALSRR